MTAIATNTASVVAANALAKNERAMNTAMERLSTGLRINSAKDDAAGLAIAKKMQAQVGGLKTAARNANDAISMLKTYEGAIKEITDMLSRMRDLTLQANTEALVTGDRTNLGLEYDKLSAEITRIASDTQWNTTSALAAGDTLTVQLGANKKQTMDIVIDDIGVEMAKLVAFSVADDTAAQTQLGLVDAAIGVITAERAAYGSYISRLEHAHDNLMNVAQNTDASRGRIEDADYASETMELARTQIIAQAGTAMLAQANQAKQTVLALLK